jgi:hypothetical protein
MKKMIIAVMLICLTGCSIPLHIITDKPEKIENKTLLQKYEEDFGLQKEAKAWFEAMIISNGITTETAMVAWARLALKYHNAKPDNYWDYSYKQFMIDVDDINDYIKIRYLNNGKDLYYKRLKNG